jgi:hypothetical protein
MSFVSLRENLPAEKDDKPDNQQQHIERYRNEDREPNLGEDFMPMRMVDDDTYDVDQDSTYKAAQSDQQFSFHLLAGNDQIFHLYQSNTLILMFLK